MRTTRTRKRRIERKQRRQRSSSLRRHLSLSLLRARVFICLSAKRALCVVLCQKSFLSRFPKIEKKQNLWPIGFFSLSPHFKRKTLSCSLFSRARIRTNDARSEKKSREKDAETSLVVESARTSSGGSVFEGVRFCIFFCLLVPNLNK